MMTSKVARVVLFSALIGLELSLAMKAPASTPNGGPLVPKGEKGFSDYMALAFALPLWATAWIAHYIARLTVFIRDLMLDNALATSLVGLFLLVVLYHHKDRLTKAAGDLIYPKQTSWWPSFWPFTMLSSLTGGGSGAAPAPTNKALETPPPTPSSTTAPPPTSSGSSEPTSRSRKRNRTN